MTLVGEAVRSIESIPTSWTFSHLISIGWLHGDESQGFQVHLVNAEDNVMVLATGGSVTEAFAEAIARTYDDRWHQPMFSLDSIRAPDEPKFDLAALIRRHRHIEPLKRRI